MRIHNCKWLLAAGLISGGLMAYQSRSELQQWFQHQFRGEGFEQVMPSEIYLLQTNRWMEFEIPSETSIARLISNASISSAKPAAPDCQWPYAIEYELRGSQGHEETTTAGVYHFKGEHVVSLDLQTGKRVELNSYLDRSYTPLSGRHWMLNLRDPAMTDARVLRLRLHSSDPDLLEVGVRVYFRTVVPQRKLVYLWDRLSDDQKRDLARGNVYSFEGLNSWEKFCLLRFHWSVASPVGIPGRDFERRALYVRDDSEKLQMLKEWVPAGLAVDAEHFGVLPLTNAPGACRLQMVDYAAATPQVVSNTFFWYDDVLQRIETNHLRWTGARQTMMPSDRDGFLQIASTRPIYVRAFHVESGRTNETTPEPVHLLAFTCSATNAVEYDVDHIGQESTLFRLELRRFIAPEKHSAAEGGVIHYDLRTADGVILRAADVALTNTFSPYDWLVTNEDLANITMSQSLCFILPPAVRTLRVSSPRDTVLINAYSRPAQLVKKVRVPEDYAPARTGPPGQPSWFTVRPRDHLERREAGQAGVVRVQPRPPEFDPLVQAGQYEWDSFLPEANARGQMILIPPADDQPPRPDSLPFSYSPVAVGGSQRIRFRAQSWQPQVQPTLVLMFTNGSPGSATVSVDGQTLLDNRLETSVTAVHLGNLKTGEHELSINASRPVAACLNYLESATNTAYLQRFCTMATSNVLIFPYVKQADSEVLVLKVFSAWTTNPQPFEVALKLKTTVTRGLGPFSDLTFLEREALVTPSPASRTWLVAATPAELDDGESVFFPIGPDLPPGKYELEVRVAAASPHWLSVSRTTPGLTEKIKLNSESRAY